MPAAEFDMSLEWFNPTEPVHYHSTTRESRPAAEFDVVQLYQTSLKARTKDNRITSDEFGVVQHSRTCSHLSTTQAFRPAAKFDMSSRWFNPSSNHGAPEDTKIIREFLMSSVWFNSPEPVRTLVYTAQVARPGVVLDMRLWWFNPTEPHRTTELQRVQGY